MKNSFGGGFARPVRTPNGFIPMYWGDGHDGILTSGRILQAGVEYRKYEDFAILELKSIYWNPAGPETLTVDQPCRGLILLVDGDVKIGANATISMAKKGSILPCDPQELLIKYGTRMAYIVKKLITLRGGVGGDGGDGGWASEEGNGGAGQTGGVGRVCQGGRGGPAGGGGRHAHGGDGGVILYPEAPGLSGDKPGRNGYNGGAGAGNYSNTAGGPGGIPYGAGPGGGNGAGAAGGNGEHTGGFVLIIARGTVSISGTIDVTGGNGGAGAPTGNGAGGGGGGAGGGVIAIFAKGPIETSTARIVLDGGAGGAAGDSTGEAGTAGGEGTFYSERI